MSDAIDREDDLDAINPKVGDTPTATKTKLPASATKTQVTAQGSIMALTPRTLDEAWKMADAFYVAGMVPKSLEGKGEKETKAKVMLAICKGAEVGFGPVTAVSTIMVINSKACLYGDGATSLVQNSGLVEWIKTEITSKLESAEFSVTFWRLVTCAHSRRATVR